MITTIIVDDEKRGRLTLVRLLEKLFPDIAILGEAASVDEAHTLIQQFLPDVVFLDIEMPNGSGFELLKKFEEIPFEVIFVTAYGQYAINAIKFCALDYLLKPVRVEELQIAIEKAQKRISAQTKDKRLNHLLKNMRHHASKTNKIAVANQEGIEFVAVEQILYCQAEGSYTKIHTLESNHLIATTNIKTYEGLLNDYYFFRVHNSFVINLNAIQRYVRGNSGYVIMKNGTEIPVARRKKDELLKHLNIS